MHVRATCARSAGRILSKYQRDRAWREGMLTIVEERDADLRRVVRVARLRYGDRDVLPPLFDAQVVTLTEGAWSITGYERVPNDTVGDLVAYQQSWIVAPVVTPP